MTARRLVVAQRPDGTSDVVADDVVPEVVLAPAGAALTMLWGADRPPRLPVPAEVALPATFLPPPGGWRAAVLTFPPAGHPAPDDGVVLDDLAARMAVGGGRGMHATPTIDVAYLLTGELVMEVDGGRTVTIGPGDTVVQNGTRHGWRNPGTTPATLLLMMVGAESSISAT